MAPRMSHTMRRRRARIRRSGSKRNQRTQPGGWRRLREFGARRGLSASPEGWQGGRRRAVQKTRAQGVRAHALGEWLRASGCLDVEVACAPNGPNESAGHSPGRRRRVGDRRVSSVASITQGRYRGRAHRGSMHSAASATTSARVPGGTDDGATTGPAIARAKPQGQCTNAPTAADTGREALTSAINPRTNVGRVCRRGGGGADGFDAVPVTAAGPKPLGVGLRAERWRSGDRGG